MQLLPLFGNELWAVVLKLTCMHWWFQRSQNNRQNPAPCPLADSKIVGIAAGVINSAAQTYLLHLPAHINVHISLNVSAHISQMAGSIPWEDARSPKRNSLSPLIVTSSNSVLYACYYQFACQWPSCPSKMWRRSLFCPNVSRL